jgi:hypothetical protein
MGHVYSAPTGISCPGTCSTDFDDGTEVTLYTKNTNGMEFYRWEGACAGVWRGDPCVLTMDSDKDVAVRFYPRESNGSSGSGSGINESPFFDGSGTWLVSPLDESTDIPITHLLVWWSLTDPNGDIITYDPQFCDMFEAGRCIAWSSVVPEYAEPEPQTIATGLGVISGIVLFGFLLGGGMRTRGGRAFLLALLFTTTGFTAVACSSSDSDSNSSDSAVSDSGQSTGDATAGLTCESVIEEGQLCKDVTNLDLDTTYHWKVVASNSRGVSLESAVWSFTTTGE